MASGLTPIIVGVGDVRQKSSSADHPTEPADLMLEAFQRAVQDTGSALSESEFTALVDSVSVVPPWTWPYQNLPALLAERLGRDPSQCHLALGIHGGNQPAMLCDEAARRISKGESKVAIVTGGEALATLAACQKANKMPPRGWTAPDPNSAPINASDRSRLTQSVGALHSVGLPIQVYPMYENGFRERYGQSLEQNTQDSAELYAAFDQTACQRAEYSWRYGETPRDAEAIRTVTDKNRMICAPYPLLMNAFNTVNLAATCILTSVEYARKLGIPESKWSYVLGGAGTSDSGNFWERPSYHDSPAIRQSIDAALEASGLSGKDIDCYDFYSCFPIVPKLACKHLGLDVVRPQKPISLLGGLTSFGGAGNNYSMHAITEMCRQIRGGRIRKGLVLANGGVLTYQHAICLSSQPGNRQYPRQRPLPEQSQGVKAPVFVEKAEGPAVIETYTVEFSRKGAPTLGHIVGRLRDGRRFIANHGDISTLEVLAGQKREPVGMHGEVKKGEDGRNLFYLPRGAKL